MNIFFLIDGMISSSRRWEGGTDGSYELHITAWSFWLLTSILKLSGGDIS